MRLYFEVARRAFGRSITYRLATLAGIATNGFFGYVHSSVLLGVYASMPGGPVAGFSPAQAVSYVWLGQALIAVVQIWFDKEIARTIVSGDVISDLARPFDFQTYWLSRFVGNSVYGLLFRALPTYLLGLLLFGAELPRDPLTVPLFLVSLALAVLASFLLGYLFNLTTFWTLSPSGGLAIGATAQMFFSGFIVPLAFMPGWLAGLAGLLPFQAVFMLPAQIWLEQRRDLGGIGLQVGWVLVLWLAARGVTRLAWRKVVIQGG